MEQEYNISQKRFLGLLNKAVKDLGGPVAAGKAWGLLGHNVSKAMRGQIPPGPVIIKAMKMEGSREILYRYRFTK